MKAAVHKLTGEKVRAIFYFMLNSYGTNCI